MRSLLLLVALLSVSRASAFFVPTVGATTTSLRKSCSASAVCTTMSSPPTLFDMPVSNNGARCRLIIYKKGLSTTEDIQIKSPADLGGLKSPEYFAVNPQGLMPCLVTEEGPIPESDTIARYLLDRFESKSPSFRPSTLAGRTKSEIITRLHDIYIAGNQQCMYKLVPPFGKFPMRHQQMDELRKQILVVDTHVDPKGPYIAGEEVSLADATLFPTLIFAQYMLPKFEPEGSKWDQKAVFGANLSRWFEWVRANDDSFSKVYTEITSALKAWDEGGRWDTILGAGNRDTDPATIFDKIIGKEIPSDIVFEDEHCLVFKDVSPQAPTHLLVIPKKRLGLTRLRHATEDHKGILGHMMATVAAVVKEQKLDSYRLVVNDGEAAGQTVFHLHMHILSGRPLTWPPG